MSTDIAAAVRESLSLLTPDQVCTLLQVDKQWLYKECQRNRFPHVKLGRQLRFKPAEVQAYIDGERQEVPAPVEPQLVPVPTAPRRGRPRKAS